MIVLKSTHAAALNRAARAEHDAADAKLLVKKLRADADRQNDANAKLFVSNMRLSKEVDRLSAELSRTWVRNARGHFQKHPTATVLTAVGGGAA